MIAKHADARSVPTIAAARFLASTVKDRRDRAVRHLPRQHCHEIDNFGVCAPAMLPDPVLAHPQRSVIAANPAHHECKRVSFNTHDDLLDKRADDPLAGRWRRAGAAPSPLEIVAERQKSSAFGRGERRGRVGCQRISLPDETLDCPQTFVPAALQLGGNETVIGIDGVVLPPRQRRLVARLFEGKLDLAPLLDLLDPGRLERAERRLDAKRLDTRDHLPGNDPVNAHAAKRDAGRTAVVEVTAATVIAPGTAVLAAVGDMQLAAAMAAAEQAGQKRLTAPDRTAAHEALPVGVVADQALVPLELGPANVAFVMVEDQSLPRAALLAEAAHDPLPTRLDRNAAAGAPEGVSAGVDRVGQDVVERVVDRQLPDYGPSICAVTDAGSGKRFSRIHR